MIAHAQHLLELRGVLDDHDLRARVAHDLGPLRNLARDVGGEFLRRAAGDLGAEAFEPRAQLRVAQGGVDVAVEPLDDRRRRGAGHDDAVPGDRLEAGHPGFGDGGQLRQAPRALRGRDGQRAQPSRLHVGQDGSRRGEHQLALAGDDIGERGLCALVGHVHHVDAGHRLEELAREMRRRAGAARCVVEPPGVRLCVRDQFRHCRRRHRWMHDEDVRLDGDQGDRREILDRIERQVPIERRVGGEDAVVAEEPGVAIGRALRDDLGGEVAAGARAVLD